MYVDFIRRYSVVENVPGINVYYVTQFSSVKALKALEKVNTVYFLHWQAIIITSDILSVVRGLLTSEEISLHTV